MSEKKIQKLKKSAQALFIKSNLRSRIGVLAKYGNKKYLSYVKDVDNFSANYCGDGRGSLFYRGECVVEFDGDELLMFCNYKVWGKEFDRTYDKFLIDQQIKRYNEYMIKTPLQIARFNFGNNR